MRAAVVCEALRTPVGGFGGALRDVPAPALAATVVPDAEVPLRTQSGVEARRGDAEGVPALDLSAVPVVTPEQAMAPWTRRSGHARASSGRAGNSTPPWLNPASSIDGCNGRQGPSPALAAPLARSQEALISASAAERPTQVAPSTLLPGSRVL